MANVEISQSGQSIELNIGDLAEITWKDHFRYRGKRPREMEVKSWGKVVEILNDGIALVQNEVQIPDSNASPRTADPLAERVMDGQFILASTITNIRLIEELNN